MKAALMVWGASSGAGKSLLTTALCRWAARQGVAVAPFKAQNMSNNARVVPIDGGPDGAAADWGEIGSAQYFQALAARVQPHVDMNPVLLKPERDTASQVVLQGRVDAALSRQPWRERSARLSLAARESFERLATRHDLLLIEGAGSPAEINLASQDYVNLGTARWAREWAKLQALLVVDIDRGGAFAHAYGTWALLPEDLRPALAGFVLNKFRGDAALLAPGPERLQAMTNVPVLGVLPMRRDHGLPEEDGLYEASGRSAALPSDALRIAVVAWPHVSNVDEFQPLAAGAALRLARDAGALEDVDWIVLPGSKQVSGDLRWLRVRGMDRAILRHVQQGRQLLGICGGMQVLGQWLDDPQGVDGEAHGPLPGLALLPLTTHYALPKRLRAGRARFDQLSGRWHVLSDLELNGYEIRCGHSVMPAAAPPSDATPALFDAQDEPIGWQAGCVLGVAVHGLFEDASTMRALFGRKVRTLDDTFDGLADLIEEHMGAAVLRALLQI